MKVVLFQTDISTFYDVQMSIFNDQCPYSMIKEEEGSEPEKRGGRETEGWREQEEGEMKGEGI